MLNRRRRAAGEDSPGPQLTLTMSRKSILPPLKSGFLRRGSEPQLPPTSQKQPLLAVTLSSPSFLDSSIRDEDSDSAQPLYRIKTSGTSTTVLRRDPSKSTVTAASIKWPKMIPLKRGKDGSDGILLMMKDGRWSGGENLLKPASKDGARKFNIPNYNHPMKWKQYGAQYWCTTPTVQGPIATFEPRKGSLPPKLSVYETLHDKNDPASLSAFRGVSILLLDYLVVTSLLLVTDLQEWMLVRKFEGIPVNVPNASEFGGDGASSAPGVASNPQWRKIAFGEPIFPKIAGDAKSIHGDISASLPPIHPNRQPSSIMTRSDDSSSSQRSPGFGMRSFIDTDLDSEEDSESEDTHYDISRAGSGSHHRSPTAESIASSMNAPSHAYADPSFYRPASPVDEPALPSRPQSGVSSMARRYIHSQPSSPLIQSYRYPEDSVPPHLPQAIRRARSVSPTSPMLEDPDVLNDILNGYHLVPNRGSRHFTPPPPPPPPSQPPAHRPSRLRSDSIGSLVSTTSRRPLPQPPVTAQMHTQELRRAQSSNALLENGQGSRANIRVTPPAPQRTLPYAPHTPRILPASPRSHATFSDFGPAPPLESYGDNFPASAHGYSHSHAQPSQNTSTQQYLHPYNTDEVHSRQPPITKSSHEDLAQWLHELTIDSQIQNHAPEPLPNSTIYDVPPPAYNSITFSSRPEGFYQPPVPVAYSQVAEVYDSGLSR
ncbi:hypothetical protein CPB83DRAFT_688947 [Crepidotus variabilis]|uniref:Uncharacterized protein n=1 Tax=Crepidotus variabilis TaxID=179855 RepID=A0A9P6E6W9_9AGAR|nr:hypothetical protein CPB83DRAFT_688947 [Crepidotus variabilis]